MLSKRKLPELIVIALFVIALLLVSNPAALAASPENQANPVTKQVFPEFKDVPATDVDALFIRYLTSTGFLKGFPDGTFGPERPLTRAEAVAVLTRNREVAPPTDGKQTFRDVGPGHWAYASIETAAREGLLAGYPDGTFRPNQLLSRAEALALVLRWSGQPLPEVQRPVPADVPAGHWAYRTVAAALDAGLVVPAGDRFNPEQPMLRKAFARSVAVTMILSPSRRAETLDATLVVKSGRVTLQNASGEKTVSGSVPVALNDIIRTGVEGRAELVFPDGSGVRLEPNTEVQVTRLDGAASICKDGRPTEIIEHLGLKLNKGQIFGALATTYTTFKETASLPEHTAPPVLVASLGITPELAAALSKTAAPEKNAPWWKLARATKVRVTVDMPWAVAGIRGTFWMNRVTDQEQVTNVLIGEATVTAAEKTVTLSGGQTTSVTAAGAPPQPPAPMSKEEVQAWQAVKEWVQERARAIEQSEPVKIEPQPAAQLETPAQPAQTLREILDEAIASAAAVAADSSSGGSSGDSGSSSGGESNLVWCMETVDGSVYGVESASMVLDLSGYPHIVYSCFDATGSHLKYAYKTGAGWQSEPIVDDAGNNKLMSTSLALDTSGNPHISYYDATNGKLIYACKNGPQWQLELVDTVVADVYSSLPPKIASLALDTEGRPHISYYDATNKKLKYAFRLGLEQWDRATVVDSVYDEGVYASIAVDRYDNPHIAYYDWSNGDLKYAYKGANGWVVETVESEGWVGWSTALALDASGRPHVSYHKCDDGTLRYAYRDADGTWHTEKVDGDQNNYTGDYTSIAVGSAGNPYIAYFVTVISNNEHLNYLKYACKIASGWQIQTVDVTEYVGCPSIALDSSGRPHISYYDGANYRLKYACLTPAQ